MSDACGDSGTSSLHWGFDPSTGGKASLPALNRRKNPFTCPRTALPLNRGKNFFTCPWTRGKPPLSAPGQEEKIHYMPQHRRRNPFMCSRTGLPQHKRKTPSICPKTGGKNLFTCPRTALPQHRRKKTFTGGKKPHYLPPGQEEKPHYLPPEQKEKSFYMPQHRRENPFMCPKTALPQHRRENPIICPQQRRKFPSTRPIAAGTPGSGRAAPGTKQSPAHPMQMRRAGRGSCGQP